MMAKAKRKNQMRRMTIECVRTEVTRTGYGRCTITVEQWGEKRVKITNVSAWDVAIIAKQLREWIDQDRAEYNRMMAIPENQLGITRSQQ